MAPELSVCVAVYRRHGPPNVASLAARLPAAAGDRSHELVVALNGIDAAQAGVPDGARTTRLEQNMGVAPGWNAAAKAAAGDVLVFCNDDAEPGPEALAVLHRALAQLPQAGVVGPAGAFWDVDRGAHVRHAEPGDGPVECDAVSGFLFACRREVWDAVGGFDEAFAPLSFEEIDFCMAVRAAGLRNYVVPGVDVAHEWGVSARQPPWRTIRWGGRRELLWSIHRRNRRRFTAKWGARA